MARLQAPATSSFKLIHPLVVVDAPGPAVDRLYSNVERNEAMRQTMPGPRQPPCRLNGHCRPPPAATPSPQALAFPRLATSSEEPPSILERIGLTAVFSHPTLLCLSLSTLTVDVFARHLPLHQRSPPLSRTLSPLPVAVLPRRLHHSFPGARGYNLRLSRESI